MTCISKTYTLTSPKEDFFAGVDKLSTKYEFTYEIFEEEKVVKTRKTGRINPFTMMEEVSKYEVDVYTVFFTFGTYQVKGYEYLGCIKDADRMGLITVHGNEQVGDTDLVDFITDMSEIPCHKCNRKTKRGIGHIFRNEETKELSVFGSTCAKNYFGIDFTKLLNLFARIDNFESKCNGGGSGYTETIDWKWFASICFYNISSFGFISGTMAQNSFDGSVESTKDSSTWIMVNWNESHKGNPIVKKEVKDVIAKIYNDNDIDSLSVHKFFDTIDKGTEFGNNLHVVRQKMNLNASTPRDLGFIAYLVNQVFFNGGRKEFEKVEINENPTEVKGDKLRNLTLKMTHKHGFEGSYGWTNIYTFIDPTTNTRYKWFSGNSITAEGEIWKDKEITFTYAAVKNIENDSKYGTSVIITRCRVAK